MPLLLRYQCHLNFNNPYNSFKTFRFFHFPSSISIRSLIQIFVSYDEYVYSLRGSHPDYTYYLHQRTLPNIERVFVRIADLLGVWKICLQRFVSMTCARKRLLNSGLRCPVSILSASPYDNIWFFFTVSDSPDFKNAEIKKFLRFP